MLQDNASFSLTHVLPFNLRNRVSLFNQSKEAVRMLIKSLNKSTHSHSQDNSRRDFVNGSEARGWQRNGACVAIAAPCHHRASGNNYGVGFKPFPKSRSSDEFQSSILQFRQEYGFFFINISLAAPNSPSPALQGVRINKYLGIH